MKPMATHPTGYQIRVEGHLLPQWMDWFDGLTVTLEENGDTILTGPVVDQAALHGLLKNETKALLSTLWVVVMLNMLKADILSLYIPGAAEELARTAGDTPIPLLMLGGAIMMEISILMILLSRVLTYRVNRWANIITSLITIAFIIGGGSSYPHYLFIAAVEVVCLSLIVWVAWKWRNPEAKVTDAPATNLVTAP
jgi:hypothetical protein